MNAIAYPGIPLNKPGPPFKLADVILCEPMDGRCQLALVTDATPPTYKLLLQEGSRFDTAAQDLSPDWNPDHPEFAPWMPVPVEAEKKLLLRQHKKRAHVGIDIHNGGLHLLTRQSSLLCYLHRQISHKQNLPPPPNLRGSNGQLSLSHSTTPLGRR